MGWSCRILFCQVVLIANHHGNLVQKKQMIGQCITIVGQYIFGLVCYFFRPYWFDNESSWLLVLKKKKKFGQCINTVRKYIWGGLVGYIFCHVGLKANHHGYLVQKKQAISQRITVVGQYVLGLLCYFFRIYCFDNESSRQLV